MTQAQYDAAAKAQLDSDPNAIYADSMREEKIANVIQQLDPSNLL